jgi:hypothetical protein
LSGAKRAGLRVALGASPRWAVGSMSTHFSRGGDLVGLPRTCSPLTTSARREAQRIIHMLSITDCLDGRPLDVSGRSTEVRVTERRPELGAGPTGWIARGCVAAPSVMVHCSRRWTGPCARPAWDGHNRLRRATSSPPPASTPPPPPARSRGSMPTSSATHARQQWRGDLWSAEGSTGQSTTRTLALPRVRRGCPPEGAFPRVCAGSRPGRSIANSG